MGRLSSPSHVPPLLIPITVLGISPSCGRSCDSSCGSPETEGHIEGPLPCWKARRKMERSEEPRREVAAESTALGVSGAQPICDGRDESNLSSTNLFIMGLPQSCCDKDLYDMCISYGKIVSTKAILDKQTNICKGDTN